MTTTSLTDSTLAEQRIEMRAELIEFGWRVRDWLYLGPQRDPSARAQALELLDEAESFYGCLLSS